MRDRENYLFDGTGAPDPDVERLERLLRPVGRRDDAPIAAPRHGRVRLFWLGGLAAAAAVTFVAVLNLPDSVSSVPQEHEGGLEWIPPVGEAAPGGGRRVAFAVDQWVETKDDFREVLIGHVGKVQLAANTRVQVKVISDDETRLYLQRGSIEATVSAEARPRFFQIDTDAARCVDLGCRYTLDVDADGVARVRVLTGRVAFEDGKREVFVPAGAVCVAKKGHGSGTPHFEDARQTVVAAFDAFDAAAAGTAERRRDLARAALDVVRDRRDTLPVWHLLQDADAEIVRAATSSLEAVAGPPQPDPSATAADVRAAWKERLEGLCW